MDENKEAIKSLISELAKAKIDEKSDSFSNMENNIKNLKREITNLELSANVAVYGDNRSAKEKLEEKAQKEALVNQLEEKLNSSKKEIELKQENLIAEIDKKINDETNMINSMQIAFFHKSGPDQIVALPEDIKKREQELQDLINEYNAVKGGQGLDKYIEQAQAKMQEENATKAPTKKERTINQVNENKQEQNQASENKQQGKYQSVMSPNYDAERFSSEEDDAYRRWMEDQAQAQKQVQAQTQTPNKTETNNNKSSIKEKERVVPQNRQPIQGQAMENGQPIQGQAMENGQPIQGQASENRQPIQVPTMGNGQPIQRQAMENRQPLNQVNEPEKEDDSYTKIDKLSIDIDYSNGVPYTGKISYKKGPFGLINGIMPDPIEEVELVPNEKYAERMLEYFDKNKLSVSEMSKILEFNEKEFNSEADGEKKKTIINALEKYNDTYDSDILQTIIETSMEQKNDLEIAKGKFGKDKKDLTYYLIDKFQSLFDIDKPGLKVRYRIGKDTPIEKEEKVESKSYKKHVSVRKVLGLFRRRRNTPLLQEAEPIYHDNKTSRGNIREHQTINYDSYATTRQDNLTRQNSGREDKDDLGRGE